MMMRLLTLSFAVAAAHDYAADVDGTGQDSKNETLHEGYSLEGLQLNLSTCDLFIVALAITVARRRSTRSSTGSARHWRRWG